MAAKTRKPIGPLAYLPFLLLYLHQTTHVLPHVSFADSNIFSSWSPYIRILLLLVYCSMSFIFLLCFVNVASFWSTISLSSLFFLWRASSSPFVWVKAVCQSLVVFSSSIWVPWSANFVFTFLICSNTDSYSFLNYFASSCFINSSIFLWTKSSDHYVCRPLSIYSLDTLSDLRSLCTRWALQ